jgi:integrase
MSILKQKKSVKLPPNATVINGNVTWFDRRGKKHIGKLTKTGRVLVESDTWQIRYRDENGKERREPAGVRNRDAALAILLQREKEVERIKMGIATRIETDITKNSSEGLAKQLELFKNEMVAVNDTPEHIKNRLQKITTITDYCKVNSVTEIKKETVVQWIANENETKIHAPRTINGYISAVKAFCEWAVNNNRLLRNPLKDIKKLKEDADRRKTRRSLTEQELNRLFVAVKESKRRFKSSNQERELIYRLLIGTGIRSKELGKAKLHQFDFVLRRFTIDPAVTKNRKTGYLPIKKELIDRLQQWCNDRNIQPKDTIFDYKPNRLLKSFYADIELAGIEQVAGDGRCIDVHSLRRTFGTMLARAGVPLTTVQKLMRHSRPELTAKLYIDVEPIDMEYAIEKLPDF